MDGPSKDQNSKLAERAAVISGNLRRRNGIFSPLTRGYGLCGVTMVIMLHMKKLLWIEFQNQTADKRVLKIVELMSLK